MTKGDQYVRKAKSEMADYEHFKCTKGGNPGSLRFPVLGACGAGIAAVCGKARPKLS